MTVAAAEGPRVRQAGPDHWWAWSRMLLLLGVVAWAAVAVLVGVRETTVADLRAQVASGEIDEIDEIETTPGLSDGSTGRVSVRVVWRDGLLRDGAEMVERRPGAVAEGLLALDPDLRIREVLWPSSEAETAGLRLPGWTSWLSFGLGFAALVAVRWWPPPSYATRWAWAWLVLSGPIGLAAYLLLAGPLPGLRPGLGLPRVRQHLTGGWAFLLALVLQGLWGW